MLRSPIHPPFETGIGAIVNVWLAPEATATAPAGVIVALARQTAFL